MRNRKMREELVMTKVKDVAELYVLADKCARAEEGRKYPGKDAGVETDSYKEDTAAPTKKGQRRNRKRKGKLCLPSRGLTTPAPPKRPRQVTPARKLPDVSPARPWRLPRSQATPTSDTARSIA